MMLFSMGLIGMFVAQNSPATPNDFFKRAMPTFIVGTAGDDRADQAIRAQATLIRDLLFPQAKIMNDSDVDVAKGPAAWPANAILFGGPHVNRVLADLVASLPFLLDRGKLAIANEVFEGDEFRLIAVIPSWNGDANRPGYPEFLLYAGTGSPGVAEINSVRHGAEPILIADAFGKLLTGSWKRATNGPNAPEFTRPRERRIPWRTVSREIATNSIAVQLRFPQQLPAAEDEELVIQACLRGLVQAAQKLGVSSAGQVTVYVYPDLGSIASITGQRGDGHAVVEPRVLQVVRSDPAAGGGFERLLAHEGTHVLAYESWGAAGTQLLGEGLAVWASGAYGGVSLNDWKKRVARPTPPIADLLGKQFRQMTEAQSYPLAGILVESLIAKLGIAKVREHLYGATSSTWQADCQKAGTTPQAIESEFQAALGRP
jgi:hypothetical protein